MTPTKRERIIRFTEAMRKQVESGGTEAAHARADELLCELLKELGYGPVVDEYEAVDKRYA